MIAGLLAQPAPTDGGRPPFLTLRAGLGALVGALAGSFRRTTVRAGAPVASVERGVDGYVLALPDGEKLTADGVVLAVPAYVAAELLAGLGPDLADAHAEIPYASSALVTLGYRNEDVAHPLDGYGYVVPRAERSDVLACSWTSSKWEGRAPEGSALLRVHTGRFGGRDTSAEPDDELVALAREEVRLLGVTAEPIVRPDSPLAAVDAAVRARPPRARRADRGGARVAPGARGRGRRLPGRRHPGLHRLGRGGRGLARPRARSGLRMTREGSERLFAEATELMPGGVSSPVRAFRGGRRHALSSSSAARARTSSTSTATGTSTTSSPGGR